MKKGSLAVKPAQLTNPQYNNAVYYDKKND